MSIADAAMALRRLLHGPDVVKGLVTGAAVRPVPQSGGAELVVRFDDGSHQIIHLNAKRVAHLSAEFATITASGFQRI